MKMSENEETVGDTTMVDDMDRTVSTKEKIRALTTKDLTIRIYRSPKMWCLFQILIIFSAAIIPLIFVGGTEWLWQVDDSYFTPGMPDNIDNKTDPHPGTYDWREHLKEMDQTGISVETEVYSEVVAALTQCYTKTSWWPQPYVIQVFDDSDGDVCTSTDGEECEIEVWEASITIRKNYEYVHKWILIPWDAMLIWGVWREDLKGIASEANLITYISACIDTYRKNEAQNTLFFNYPQDLSYTWPANAAAGRPTDTVFTKTAQNADDIVSFYDEITAPTGTNGTVYMEEGQKYCFGQYDDVQCSLWNQMSDHTTFYRYNTIKWDDESWSRNQVSVMYILAPGVLWGFCIFFATTGFFMHVVQERNSGIKTIMMSMGLSNEIYLLSQFISFLIENACVTFFLALFVAIMVGQGAESSGNAFYAWFATIMCMINMAPFYMGIAPAINNEKNASSVTTILKWVVPLVPCMIIVPDLNDESVARRFFGCFLPPVNLMFVIRDAVRDEIYPEPCLMLFLNFFIWWGWAYYFDLVMPSSSGQANQTCCFCTKYCQSGKAEHGRRGQATELTNMQGSSDGPLLVVKDLVKEFGTFTAVDHMQLSIESGTIYGLLGFNGAGKTTTISMITGILGPTAGTIHVAGHNIETDMNLVRAYIGMCPQHNVLFDLLTVEQHMYLFGRLRGMTPEMVDAQMDELLKAMNMDHQRKTLAEELSGGQKRMLCMIQAFLGNPKLVLLDEPTSGVDAESRRAMWDFIEKNREGKVIILTTHQMREADVLCDKIGIMSAGQLLVEDTPLNLKNKYAVGFTFSAHGANEDEVRKLCQQTIPEAEVDEDEDEVTVSIPAKYADQVPEFVAQLEKLESVEAENLNVKAATLETVFLQIAKDVEQKGAITKLGDGFMGGSTVHLPGTDEDNDRQGDGPAGLARSNTMDRLSGLSTEIGDFDRPNPCFQLCYLLVKRCWLSIVYWEPFVTGLAQSCTLAFCVTFILVFFGVNTPGVDQNIRDISMEYAVNDPSNPGALWENKWESVVGGGNLVDYDNYEYLNSMGWRKRDGYDDPMVVISEPDGIVYTDAYHTGYWFSVAAYHGADVTVIDYSAKGQSDLTNFFVMPILVLGLGLIVSSTWHHVGKEVKEGLYDFQIQSGVNPVLLWFSHWVFDVCINTIMVSVFLAIALSGDNRDDLRSYCIYGGLVAFMPYVIIQYILVWGLNNEKSIEACLTWSTFLGIGIFILELLHFTKMFSDSEPIGVVLFQSEATMWEEGSDYQFFLLVHYFVPPIQFMHAMFQSLNLYYQDGASNFDNLKSQYYARIWKSLISTMVWSLIFLLLQIYVANKKDPVPEGDTEMKLTEDVVEEKNRCAQMAKGGDEESGASGEKPMILANGLTKTFTKHGGPFIAVNDISFHVKKGECFGLLGKNGAGKSTTMNMMTTLLSQSKGECWLGGHSDTNKKQQIIGYCPQKDLLWEKLTVYQYLVFFGLLKGVPPGQINTEITKLCVGLTLDPYYSRASGKLSGGNKRKLILASALIGSSEVVFLDEPSTGVDPFARKCMMDVIKRYIENRAIILTTHMMEEVEVCKRVGIMVNGNFRCVDTIDGLIRSTGSGYQMEISLSYVQKDEIEAMTEYILANLPNSIKTQEDFLVMAFQIPKSEKTPLSKIFEVGQYLKSNYKTEYVISQMTMDQLFLQLTHDQAAADMEDGVRGGMTAVEMCCCGMCCCEKGFCGGMC